MSETSTIGQERLHWRGLTSLTVVLAFLVLATTGVVMYFSPQGRVANWTGWTFLGLARQQWMAIHTTMALLFILASGFHIYFNWQALVRYLVLKPRFHLKREMIGAIAVVMFVLLGTTYEIPPFSNIIGLSGHARAHWGSQALLQTEPAESTPSEAAPKDTEERYAGRGKGHRAGLGRQTLQSLCENNSLLLDDALGILQEQGFTAKADSTLKALAEQKGVSPAEVRDILIKKNE